MDAKSIGLFIRKKRKELNMSQKDLAEKLFVEPQTISKWERGIGFPDLINIERMKEIFSCSFEEILEYKEVEISEEEKEENKVVEEIENKMYLPIINSITENKEEKERDNLKFFDYLSKQKVDDFIVRNCGEEYLSNYSLKNAIKNIFKRKTKEEFEYTITQGMFKKDPSKTDNSIKGPWLFLRLFLFIMICFLVGLLVSYLNNTPTYAIIFGCALAALPLVLFIFELNYSRSISIFNVILIFFLGGICSLLITLILNVVSFNNAFVSTAILAPITEEIAKAIIVIVLVYILKPKDLLSGLLIGFSVGAGFCVLESYQYCINTFGESLSNYVIEELVYTGETTLYSYSMATLDSIYVVFIRTISDFFGSHHYYTGIFGALFVYNKTQLKFKSNDVFNYKTALTLLASMSLHAMWNASGFIEIEVIRYFFEIFDCTLCTVLVGALIKIGIEQHRVVLAYELSKTE